MIDFKPRTHSRPYSDNGESAPDRNSQHAHPVRSHATFGFSAAGVAAASLAVGAGASIYGATQANKAANKSLDEQKRIAANLKYEPIDIEKLRTQATQNAIENATNALALERNLTPNVAALREQTDKTKLELARQVGADLELGGELSADTINRVNQAGRVIGARSGVGSGGTVPLTASLLGLSSIDLMNSRRNAANALQGPGALAPVGLDPGAVASEEIAQNAAYNDFNMAKAGVDSRLAEQTAAARTAQIGGQVGTVSSLSNLMFGAPKPLEGGIFGAFKKPPSALYNNSGSAGQPSFLKNASVFQIPTG